MNVTIFRSLTDKVPNYITLETALQRIASGKQQQLITELRSGNKELKKSLPIVLFSGEFLGRNDKDISNHSGIIVIDFDHIDVENSKSILATDQYVHACWISPSGDGLKALVKITNPERHRDHFRALEAYFSKQYGLSADATGKNEARACFESYDPDLVFNNYSERFGGMLSEDALEQKAERRDTYTDYLKLNIAAKMIRFAEDGQKHAMLLKASVLCGGYIAAGRMEEDEVLRVLVREILKRDIESEELALKTIRDGIEKGKGMPIREIIEEESSYQREMLINDGDMSFISSDDEDFRWIDDFANGRIEVGLDTGNDNLDKYFRYKREFMIVNGHSNVGKTTFILFLIANSAIRHGWKWVIYSSENRTASLKSKLMQFYVDRPVQQMDYQERLRAYNWVKEHFIIINNNDVYSYTDLMLFSDKLMRQNKFDGFFIDPYNSLKIQMSAGSAISTHEYHYEAASEFLTYAKRNNIAVWLNTHAVTEAQRRRDESGQPIAPFAEDTEGGGKFVNRADGFITIHRKIQHPEPHVRRTTEMHVRKVREVETGGEPTPYGEPVYFEMNASATGFRPIVGHNLFRPMAYESFEQPKINFELNSDILNAF
jgi:hypothetical protein